MKYIKNMDDYVHRKDQYNADIYGNGSCKALLWYRQLNDRTWRSSIQEAREMVGIIDMEAF